MIKAVIFDMYETLITHYASPLYFGTQMAQDAKMPAKQFRKLWASTEYDRSIGKITPVSYTHLDVYKRQVWVLLRAGGNLFLSYNAKSR